MNEVKEYLEGLSVELAEKIKARMIDVHLGTVQRGDPIKECSCVHETPNGHCAKINGVCTWIPDIG